jgi:hypothetical protein
LDSIILYDRVTDAPLLKKKLLFFSNLHYSRSSQIEFVLAFGSDVYI